MLALTSVASAAPTVTFKAKAVPIKGFPHTGNILGAGTAFESVFTIKGTEYGGYPPPVIGINVVAPKGSKVNTKGFPTCPNQIIVEEKEPEKCPKGSSAGPVGHANGFVVFGNERVPETVSIESFYAPGGGLNFYVAGHTPASIEIVSKGKFSNLTTAPKISVDVPLVETVPGAPAASVESIVSKVGSAYKKNGKPHYYLTVPKKCPKGGFPVTAEVKFAGLGGLTEQTVVSKYKAPCPRKK
ncbi:MAG TPA: hypothetical protein VFY36_02430 [Solirubrobacteraceae bacterium]|nr:hypothetical protein [Solirubrobacteraceae bacterium]